MRIKELLSTIRGRRLSEELYREIDEVVKPIIDNQQLIIDGQTAFNNDYGYRFGHRDTQPTGHPHHMGPAEHSLTDSSAPMRRP